MDSVPETLKFIEDAINSTGINDDESKPLKIGINCEGESFYTKDTGKYDMEGPKNLFDSDQMIDWYIKFCNEHPLICYMEDMLGDLDIEGYQKAVAKFKDQLPHVLIGLKTMMNSSLDTIKHHT
jgi:enolase